MAESDFLIFDRAKLWQCHNGAILASCQYDIAIFLRQICAIQCAYRGQTCVLMGL
jgi:hypothetical protein